MKLKLILHVGIHKTGTTAIQSFLSMNKVILKNYGFYFPQVHCTIENKPVILTQAIQNNDKDKYQKILQEIILSAKNEKCHTVILSDEDFQLFAHFGNDNIGVLNQFFDVKIVMYIRRQDRYSESAYSFWVQWYGKRTTIEPRYLLRLFPILDYNYLLTRWENLFGISNIVLKVYDNVVLNGNLIEDFISILDIDRSEKWGNPKEKDSNITLNKYIIEFLRRTNHIPLLFKEFEELKHFLANESSIKKGPKANFLEKAKIDHTFELAKETNALVAERYFFSNELFPKISIQEDSDSLSDESFYRVIDEIEQSHKFSGSITNEIISINIERLRDIIIKDREKQENLSLVEYLNKQLAQKIY